MTNKTVRPIMTVEARDELDVIHRIVEKETRSESLIYFSNDWSDRCKVIIKLRSEVAQWKIIAWSMTAACVALVATMMITGA